MIAKIAKYITEKPFLIQVAKDDVWEETWNIETNEKLPDEKEISSYLLKKEFKTVGVEALFKDEFGQIYILGLAFNNNLKIKNALDFLRIFFTEVDRFVDFENFIKNLDNKIVGGGIFFQGEPDLIRIGIVNHWFSVGPLDFWKKGEKKEVSHDIFVGKLKDRLELLETKLNYQGMAFVFNLKGNLPGLRHWMKSPCCIFENGAWKLNEKIIFKYLQDWQDFKII